jgi:phosphatidylglycerophosphate synthase
MVVIGDPNTSRYTQIHHDVHFSSIVSMQKPISQHAHAHYHELDTAHPRNWSMRKKVWIISILLFLEFYVTIIATTGSSAAHYAEPDFSGSRRLALLASFVSTYCLGQAVGAISMPQFTESHGRRWFYIWSSLAFSLLCAFTGMTKPLVGIILGRFLSGLCSAIPAVVVGGSIEDIFDEKQRIWPIWCWNGFTVAGQVLGPVYGTYVASSAGWYVFIVEKFAVTDHLQALGLLQRCHCHSHDNSILVAGPGDTVFQTSSEKRNAEPGAPSEK